MIKFLGIKYIFGGYKDSIINIRLNKIIDCIDYFILVLVIFTLVGDFILIFSATINHLIDFFNININENIFYMVDPNTSIQSNSTTTNVTTTRIIHDDGSFSNTVRSLFIYGTGAFRLSLLKASLGGTPGSRAFVIASTIASDAVTKMVNNTINDPAYVRSHSDNWKAMWDQEKTGEVRLEVDNDTVEKLASAANDSFNFIPSDTDDIANTFLKGFFDKFQYILEPVQVDYSNSVLANQINDISILLFILSLLIIGLITVLIFNMFIYINMDRIINYFNNSFIRWYLSINKKLMSIEIFILGSSILYFMFTLSKGILFIATHPITIN